MNGRPIQVCPVCQYDLQSLPRNYRCPECGFEYEETMRVWSARLPKGMVWVPLVFLAVFCLAVVAKFLIKPGTTFSRPLAFAMSGMLLVTLINVSAYYRFRGFIVIGVAGIYFRFKRQRVEFRPWSEVQLNNSIWLTDLSTGSPSLPRYLPAQYLKGAEREAIRNEIMHRLRAHYSGESTKPPRAQHEGKKT